MTFHFPWNRPSAPVIWPSRQSPWPHLAASPDGTGGNMPNLGYQNAIIESRQRARSCGTRVLNTLLGPIEPVARGEVPPVLVAHGVVGGRDRGKGIVDAFVGEGFKTFSISPSWTGGGPKTSHLPSSTPRAVMPSSVKSRTHALPQPVLADQAHEGHRGTQTQTSAVAPAMRQPIDSPALY